MQVPTKCGMRDPEGLRPWLDQPSDLYCRKGSTRSQNGFGGALPVMQDVWEQNVQLLLHDRTTKESSAVEAG